MRLILVTLCTLLFYTSAHAAGKGRELYDQHCSACHGSRGQGGTGVPLALDDFQRQVSDQFLFNSIKYGRPGRVMPAYSALSQDEVQSIVQYVRSFTNVTPPTYDNIHIRGNEQHGQQLYQKHCASCHGANGQGGKGTGVTFSRPRDLPILAPALNNSGFLASASDQMIKRTLMQGRKGTPMVSYLEQGLTEQDINDIVSYIRSFEHQQVTTQDQTEDIPLTIEYESNYSMEKVVKNIEIAAKGRNFKLIRVQTMDDGLMDKKDESKKEVIVYFCNFKFLNEALKVDSRVGMFLPCRVTAYEQDGVVKVIAINPKRLSHMFNNNELNELCDQMYEIYTEILEEATL